MTRQARTVLALFLALGAGSAAAQEPELFMGGRVGGSQGSELTAPWRGGRHSGVVPDYHLVHRGDTLWDITGYYYGNPWDWPRVWAINPEIANPHWIYPNDRVRLGGEPQTASVSSPGIRVSGQPSRNTGSIRIRNDGYLDAEALEHEGRIVGSPTDHMMLTANDEIWIRYEEDRRPPNGTGLTIYRTIPASERDSDERGVLVRVLGSAVVRSYDRERHVVRAQIVDATEPIERGFEVAEIARQATDVPPVPNERDLDTTVAATLFPRDIVGDQQIVFVEVGQEEGVRLGNRFFAVREADPWFDSMLGARQSTVPADGRTRPESDVEFPPEVIAEARVVALRPHSSTLLITRATQEIRVGERMQMRRGF